MHLTIYSNLEITRNNLILDNDRSMKNNNLLLTNKRGLIKNSKLLIINNEYL